MALVLQKEPSFQLNHFSLSFNVAHVYFAVLVKFYFGKLPQAWGQRSQSIVKWFMNQFINSLSLKR